MSASRRGQWKLVNTKENPASTRFKSIGMKDGLRLVLCKPQTGKTHQIRVAMKSNASPIAGDPIYDAANASAFDRLYLHAYAIQFFWDGQNYAFHQMPTSGQLFLDQSFTSAIEKIHHTEELFD